MADGNTRLLGNEVLVKTTTPRGREAPRSQHGTHLACIQWCRQARGSEEGRILSRRHLLLKITHRTAVRDQHPAPGAHVKDTLSSRLCSPHQASETRDTTRGPPHPRANAEDPGHPGPGEPAAFSESSSEPWWFGFQSIAGTLSTAQRNKSLQVTPQKTQQLRPSADKHPQRRDAAKNEARA